MKNINRKILVFLILGFVFLYTQNNLIDITKINKEFENLPGDFEGYKIVHLSDLHNKVFGNNQNYLIGKIDKLNPNIIVFTGDLVDSKKGRIKDSIDFLSRLAEKYPVYFVSGNQEWWSGNGESILRTLEENKINVLRNEIKEIKLRTKSIYIAGVDDPEMDFGENDQYIGFERRLKGLNNQDYKDEFSILLSHRPENFEFYASEGFDLSFAGHSHGGQFRIPFIGGLVSPNQGFFPKYTSGLYEQQGSFMVVSRGLGNSIIPQRIFNRPQIILVSLHSKEK